MYICTYIYIYIAIWPSIFLAISASLFCPVLRGCATFDEENSCIAGNASARHCLRSSPPRRLQVKRAGYSANDRLIAPSVL